MSKPDLTRKYIASVFKTILETKPYNKITVQDIVERADINRKTFYYHFFNKCDLITYIFRLELADELMATFPKGDLICDTEVEEDKYRLLPFFVQNTLDDYDRSEFFLTLSRYIQRNDAYYRKLSQGEDWTTFERYTLKIYLPQLKKTIERFFNKLDTVAPDDDVEYLASYYTHSTVLWLFHRHTTKQKHYSDETKEHLANLFYENISNTVENQARRINRLS